MTIDFCPSLEYIALFNRYLCKVSNETRWGRGRREETKRRAETRNDESRERAENEDEYSQDKEQEDKEKGRHGSVSPSPGCRRVRF